MGDVIPLSADMSSLFLNRKKEERKTENPQKKEETKNEDYWSAVNQQ